MVWTNECIWRASITFVPDLYKITQLGFNNKKFYNVCINIISQSRAVKTVIGVS